MSSDKIKQALESIPYGVSVVTVGQGGVENGLTVSWFSQVSFHPPMIMIAVDSKHYSVEFLHSTKNFTLNLLGQDQKSMAAHFAKASDTQSGKLDGHSTREAESGGTILTEALAYIDCELHSSHQVGSHTMFVGKVVAAERLNDGLPLTTASGLRYRK